MGDGKLTVDLEDLQDIMNELPDTPNTAERRKNALTKDDILIIAHVVKAVSRSQCGRFTDDEVITMKKHIGYFNKTANAIGTAILFVLTSGIIVIVTKGFWVTLAEKVTKQGGH